MDENTLDLVWNNFEKLYCVHLPEDSDRRTHMENEFSKLNILNKITWLSANRPLTGYSSSNYQFPGEFGCTLSHLKVLVDAIGSIKPIAVFEDDAVFAAQTEQQLTDVLNNLPLDWSIIRLGGRPLERLEIYNKHLCVIKKFTQATGYIVNPIYLKDIAKFILDRLGRNFPDACADNLLNDYTLLNNIPGYTCYPPIIWQKDGYSTLRLGNRAYKNLTDQSWVKYKP